MTAREMCALTDAEKNIFEYDWQDFWKYHYRHNDDVMNILRDSRDVINLVCEIAKHDLKQPFGGIYARKDEFGWAPLLPDHFNIPRKRMIPLFDINTQWIDWIGTTDNRFITPKNMVIVMLGVTNLYPPVVDAVYFAVDDKDYPIEYLATLEREHQRTSKFPVQIVLSHGQSFNMKTHVFNPGIDALQPIGVIFATGEYLRDLSRSMS